MKDLRSQLAEAFGAPLPEPEAPPAEAQAPDLLSDGAWCDDPWVERLRALLDVTPGAPALAPRPRLGQARQVTDQLVKQLKRDGRGRDARALKALKDDFFSRREGAAWAAIKARFSELELSNKAYRALKQGGGDPVAILEKLERADPATLQGMGAARLRAALT